MLGYLREGRGLLCAVCALWANDAIPLEGND